nr:hypothetical protein [Tanacetum cinerariifolium]
MCDMPFHDNSPPLDASKDQIEDLSEFNEEFSSTDDDSFSLDNIDYVEASPPNSELVSSEVIEIVIPKVGGIKASNDNPIPFYDPFISGTPPNLTPSGETNFFLEVDAFLAIEDEFTSCQFPKSYLDPEGDMLLFKAFLNDDHSSNFKTKSSSTSLNSLLEETNNFHNSLPEFTTFLKEEIIPMKFLRTHDSSLLISSKIDSLLDEFAGELTLLKSIPPGIDETYCDFKEDIRFIKKLLYDNSSPHGDTGILNIKMMGDISDEKAFMHKLMITLASHQEISPDLLSHRCGTVKKFNTHRSHLNKCPMLIHGQNDILLDVLLFHFYPP